MIANSSPQPVDTLASSLGLPRCQHRAMHCLHPTNVNSGLRTLWSDHSFPELPSG